jgi:hypothetical protein
MRREGVYIAIVPRKKHGMRVWRWRLSLLTSLNKLSTHTGWMSDTNKAISATRFNLSRKRGHYNATSSSDAHRIPNLSRFHAANGKQMRPKQNAL